MRWTEEQQAIIEHQCGHAKVSAVAGSGKTATLVERVARLLDSGVHSKRLQVVMFNASACSSFTHRLRVRLKGAGCSMPEVRTFHSLGMRLCRFLGENGYIPNWRLETQDWVEARMASDALELVTGEKPQNDVVESFTDFISLVKSDIISADDKYPEATEITGKPMPSYFIEAYERFEGLRARAGIRFFSDLIYDPVMRLLEDEALAAKIGNRLDHLLVDEYQDINEVQQALVTIIAGNTASVMVVGDVDQCIYEWRGARPEYIQTLFDADFPQASTYRLSYTFRYGHRVSLLANHVISHNKRRDDKLCLSHTSTPDTRIALHHEGSAEHPAVTTLRAWVDAGRSLDEAAILVRLYGMSAGVELALLKDRVPYRLDGREGVFARKEARMLFGYLRLASGRFREPSPDGGSAQDYAEAMLSFPMLGLPRATLQRVARELAGNPGAAVAIVDRAILSSDIQEWCAKKLRKRAALWDEIAAMGTQALASDVLKKVWDALQLTTAIMKQSVRQESGRDRLEVCRSLTGFVAGMTVSGALEELDELMSESASSAFEAKPSAVTITSIHKAKGLEWPLVILPGMREGGIPVEDADGDGPRTEAERRLCYVAMTRAQESLVMLHPEDSDLHDHCASGMTGPAEGVRPIASRFLYEANPSVCESVAMCIAEGAGKVAAVSTSVASAYLEAMGVECDVVTLPMPSRRGGPVCGPTTPCRAVKGMRVKHAQFGLGVITDVFPRGSSIAIQVKLDNGSDRIIIANLAILEEVVVGDEEARQKTVAAMAI